MYVNAKPLKKNAKKNAKPLKNFLTSDHVFVDWCALFKTIKVIYIIQFKYLI